MTQLNFKYITIINKKDISTFHNAIVICNVNRQSIGRVGWGY